MASIPIVAGIYSDNGPDIRTAFPVNMMPVPKGSGVSQEYLRPHDGVVEFGQFVNAQDRGGINWNGICYRVMGTKLVSVSSTGAVTVLGDVGGPVNEYVTFDYSFDLLAIASGGRLYYWSPTLGLQQVTDPDLGVVLDVVWVDGFFMTTDGEFLVVTDLTNPLSVSDFKYEASEIDPDPVVALVKFRNEIYALNRNTIEVFSNVGTFPFPFQVVDGAQIMRGTVGTHACCAFGDDGIAFLGSGRNESPSIYLGANALSAPLATQDVDLLLQTYTEAQLATVKLEARIDRAHKLLYVHLPDRTLVYDHAASQALNMRVWFTLTGGVAGFEQYPARNLVWAYDKWLVGSTKFFQYTDSLVTPLLPDNNLPTLNFDFISGTYQVVEPEGEFFITTESGLILDTEGYEYGAIGCLDRKISSQWGEKIRWEFVTPIVYNESRGALFHELELVALPGRVTVGSNPTISTSYSTDGLSWSQDRFISAGTTGNTTKRLVWFQQGHMENMRMQRFRGDSDAHISFLRLEARLEPLAV
jgi:hypothetical protein